MEYDAVVVGGGPAGSVTSRFAADLGARVLILERRSEIGVPILQVMLYIEIFLIKSLLDLLQTQGQK